MNLFSKEKELIFKIVNGILLLWFVGALVFVCGSAINLIIKEPVSTYNEYKVNSCYYFKDDTTLTAEEQDEQCNESYIAYKDGLDNYDYYKWISLYNSFANVIIVSVVLIFINIPIKKNK